MTKRYGFLREVEAVFLDELMVRLKQEFGYVKFLEVGVAGGGTVRGIHKRCDEIGCPVSAAGVDFDHQLPNPPPPNYKGYPGDSMDVWRNIPVTESFNLLLIDGCHCKIHSMCDFLNYSPFVELNGYALFHDTALPTGSEAQGEWPQDHSYAGKPKSILGVRDGLKAMGLLQNHRNDWKLDTELPCETGLYGFCLFQKVGGLGML